MSKLDVEKEKISLAKSALGILVGLIFALTGWIVTVYTKVDSILLILSFILIIVCVYGSIFLLKYIIYKIESLKDL
ncbi:MAG: hypothetical protein AB7D96_00285 [Arcobacteraceae bacterium]